MEGLVARQRVRTEDTVPVRLNEGDVLRQPLSERAFEAQLCHERRRAERSGRPIALVLVEYRPGGEEEGRRRTSRLLMNALCESVRITDIVGWQKRDEVAGAILTELGSCEHLPVLQRIQAATGEALFALPPLEKSSFRVSVQFFPEDCVPEADRQGLDMTFYPEFTQQRNAKSVRDVMKRATDIAGSGLALVVLWPLFAVVASAIRLTSPGPALYRQERMGQFGVRFTMYKFRTMHCSSESSTHEKFVKQFIGGQVDAGENGGIYKLSRDPRVTRLGRFLRKTSLDELPQFLNVLKGQMSLVGPRPPLRYELAAYEPWHRRRLLEAKPGLTGLWQVTGRSRTRFDEMVRLDLRYAKKRTFLLDVVLLLKTIRVIISDDGAC